MTHLRTRRALSLLLGALTVSPALAQQPAAKPQKKPTAATAAKPEAADPLAEQRRAHAATLLSTLADEARNYKDPALRALTQARAADALWETDKAKARTLFRRAWEAAEAADIEQGEQRAREASRRGQASSRDAGSVRREVLRLAARRETALGDEFLKKLDESAKQDSQPSAQAPSAGESATQRINPDDPPSTMTQRLNLARQLLEDGDAERAMQFADPALYPVNTFGMNFLDMLRERDMKAADQRYVSILTRAAGDPGSDANSVSLLSSYVFTPYMYITVRPDGNSHTRRWKEQKFPAGFDENLRVAFLRAAAQILTRPLTPVEQDTSSAGRTGTYVVATRLAPLFEKYTPDIAAQVRARQSALAQDTPERLRAGDDRLFTQGLVPEPSRGDMVQDALDRIDRAKSADERDMIYFRLAMNFAEEDLTRARDYASKIEDIDTRRQLMAALSYRAMEDALRHKRAEDAVRLAHAEELTSVQRAWALTEAARLVSKESPGRAVQLLEEALTEAKRIDAGTADRVRATVAVATRLYSVDRARAWDMLPEVVKAANAAADFTGEDGSLIIQVKFKNGGAMTSANDAESFDLAGLFASLAREDFDRAAEIARGFKEESPRAAATLAVARGVLVKERERGGDQETNEAEERR